MRPSFKVKPQTQLLAWYWRPLIWLAVLFSVIITIALVFIIGTKTTALGEIPAQKLSEIEVNSHVFPIGVDPETKTVTENPDIETYLKTYIASNHTPTTLENSWRTRLIARLALMDWYQNLASPISRVLVIESGQRKEEVVANFSKILRWTKTEQTAFLEQIESASTLRRKTLSRNICRRQKC
jgi:hypothetical protein